MQTSLHTLLPQAWYRKAWWLWLLLPLSALYYVVIALRKLLYRYHVFKCYQSPVPVMVIGNITAGGSGKTPMIIALVNYLTHDLGLNVAVISRGYGAHIKQATLVSAHSDAQAVGDEPLLIAQRTQVLLAVGQNRQQAIELLLNTAQAQQKKLDLILSDDGLQHYALARALEWVIVDKTVTTNAFGNGFLLPAGPLREPLSRLQSTTVITHVAPQDTGNFSTPMMYLQANDLWALHPPFDAVMPRAGDTVYALAGIAKPQRFFNTLKALGFNIIEKTFADHHAYQAADITQLADYPIITTEKDAVKLAALNVTAWVLRVDAVLSPACLEVLKTQLTHIGVLSSPLS